MGEVISVPIAEIKSGESNVPDVLPLAKPDSAAPQAGHIRRFLSKVHNAVK